MRVMMVIALGVLLSASVVMANGIGVYGSYWKPEDMENSWGAGAKVQVEVVSSIFIEARGGYFHEMEMEDADEDDPKLSVIPLEVAGLLKFPVEQLTPYVGAGVGYYMFDVTDEPEGVSIDVESKVGYFAVAGLELALGENISLFGEGKYTWLEEVEVEVKSGPLKVTDEGDLNGFGANVGLLLKW